jgi:hypothetical protein
MEWRGRARVPARREQVCMVDTRKRSSWSVLGSANHPAAAGRGRDPSRRGGRVEDESEGASFHARATRSQIPSYRTVSPVSSTSISAVKPLARLR